MKYALNARTKRRQLRKNADIFRASSVIYHLTLEISVPFSFRKYWMPFEAIFLTTVQRLVCFWFCVEFDRYYADIDNYGFQVCKFEEIILSELAEMPFVITQKLKIPSDQNLRNSIKLNLPGNNRNLLGFLLCRSRSCEHIIVSVFSLLYG